LERRQQDFYDAGESDGQVVAFALSVSDGTVQELGRFPIDDVYAFVISPDANTIAIADERGTIQFIDTSSEEAVTSIKTVDQPVDLAWNPLDGTLAVLGYETALQLWDFEK
jgi:WD40 repeat protein